MGATEIKGKQISSMISGAQELIKLKRPSCSAIVCAYNEEKYLASVLDALVATETVEEVIVVDDGSIDRTAAIAARYCERGLIRLIRLFPNAGKGAAMAAGVEKAQGDILLFVDADLENWSPEYAKKVIEPVASGRTMMTIGYPIRERDTWDMIDPLKLQRKIAGERALWRKDLLPLLDQMRPSRFGVETLINLHYAERHLSVLMVQLRGLKHLVKFEKKLGPHVFLEYIREGMEIFRVFIKRAVIIIFAHKP